MSWKNLSTQSKFLIFVTFGLIASGLFVCGAGVYTILNKKDKVDNNENGPSDDNGGNNDSDGDIGGGDVDNLNYLKLNKNSFSASELGLNNFEEYLDIDKTFVFDKRYILFQNPELLKNKENVEGVLLASNQSAKEVKITLNIYIEEVGNQWIDFKILF